MLLPSSLLAMWNAITPSSFITARDSREADRSGLRTQPPGRARVDVGVLNIGCLTGRRNQGCPETRNWVGPRRRSSPRCGDSLVDTLVSRCLEGKGQTGRGRAKVSLSQEGAWREANIDLNKLEVWLAAFSAGVSRADGARSWACS
jgi:hypothetical protein